MSDKTELPKEWQQEADKIYSDPYVCYGLDLTPFAKEHYIVGAKAMRDAMEKKIKDKHDITALQRKKSTDIHWMLKNAQINILEELLKDLKFLTPTQDEPTA